MKLDLDLLKARIFHGLKNLLYANDTLDPRQLEIIICEAFNLDHVGDHILYADGIRDSTQISVKTRKLTPRILVRNPSKDFQSHPKLFLGPQQNVKQNIWTAGLEIVQRRQQLDFKNDRTEAPEKIGISTLLGFQNNINESYKKFKTNITYEVIAVHGYNKNKSSYIVSLFWQQYVPLDINKIIWVREGDSVAGYSNNNGISMKICQRVNGNAKREATCFKEYKDVTKYTYSANIKVPIPELWVFNKEATLAEINQLEQLNVNPILF